MCENLKTEIEALRAKSAECSKLVEERWGSITKIRLPCGGEIGLYQPSTRGRRGMFATRVTPSKGDRTG